MSTTSSGLRQAAPQRGGAPHVPDSPAATIIAPAVISVEMPASTATTMSVAQPTHAHTAPVSGWRRALGDTALVAGATAVCHVVAAVTALLLRIVLDPAQMGVWQGLKLWLGYGNFASLGASKGAALELTVARGRGQAEEAAHGLNVAFTVNTLTSIIYGAMLAAAGAWIGSRSSDPWSRTWAIGLVVIGLLSVLQRFVTYQVTILRAQQRFAVTSRLAVFEAIATLVLSVTATWLWGLSGLVVATVLVVAGSWWWLAWERAPQLAWAWDWGCTRRLVAIGAPILVSGMLATLLRSIDRLMILGYLEHAEFQLGCYSAALMVSTQCYGVANVLSLVMGPRYGELYGRLGDRGAVARLAAQASELQAAALALLAGLVITAAPVLLERILPAYRAGLPALAWLMPGVIAAGMAIPVSQALVAVARQRVVVAALAASLVVAVVANHLALSAGYGLRGVAAATSLANVCYYLLLIAALGASPLGLVAGLRYAIACGLVLLPTLSAAVAFAQLQGQSAAQSDVRQAVLHGTYVGVVWCITAGIGWRYGGWRGLWNAEQVS